MTPANRRSGTFRRGFTLVEMLVVLAVTAILLTIVMLPLSQSFNLTQRAQAQATAQSQVRNTMRRITREIEQAMFIYDARAVNMWSYDRWATVDGRPVPDPAAVPVSVVMSEPILDIVLPRHRYYCKQFDHSLEATDVGANVAIDRCPWQGHQNSELELRPLMPLQMEPVIVRYFVGLKEPGWPTLPNTPNTTPPGAAGNTSPHYYNGHRFPGASGDFDNPYVLYRVEFESTFDLANPPPTANFLSPNFFYERPQNGAPAGAWNDWKIRSVAMMAPANSDLVRIIDQGNGTARLDPMCKFLPGAVESEVAQPIQAPISLRPSSTVTTPALEYALDWGHWTGVQNDGTLTVPPALAMQGPRVQVFSGGGGTLVYDSANTSVRERLLSYNSRQGRVRFGMSHRHNPGSGPSDVTAWEATVQSDLTVDLKQDTSTYTGSLAGVTSTNIPGGFGSARNNLPNGPLNVRLVPASEVVQVVQNASQGLVVTLRRVGWTGLGPTLDRWVAQADLAPDEFTIDYATGVITLSEQYPQVATTGSDLWVRYHFQTNRADDVVRVTYNTWEQVQVTLGLVKYSPRGDGLTVQQTQKVRVKNMLR